MTFLEAVLHANADIYDYLHVKGLAASDHALLGRGAGGDESSAIDQIAEAIFVRYLSPFGTILSEESGKIGSCMERIIVLDPIDGSDNLLSHLPYYGTSVAYFEGTQCVCAVVVNLANAEVFIKDAFGFRRGFLQGKYDQMVMKNPFAKVGLFERSYCSQRVLPVLHSLGLKYRSPGAFALSLAYAHDVSFVLYEGEMREYDIAAGRFMCEGLHLWSHEEIFLVSKDKETFDTIFHLFSTD